MSANTYILMQSAIQSHLQDGGTVMEVLEALKQSLTLDAQDGAWSETRAVNALLSTTQKLVKAELNAG